MLRRPTETISFLLNFQKTAVSTEQIAFASFRVIHAKKSHRRHKIPSISSGCTILRLGKDTQARYSIRFSRFPWSPNLTYFPDFRKNLLRRSNVHELQEDGADLGHVFISGLYRMPNFHGSIPLYIGGKLLLDLDGGSLSVQSHLHVSVQR